MKTGLLDRWTAKPENVRCCEAVTEISSVKGAYPLIACTEQFSMQILLKTCEIEWNRPESTVWTFCPFYHKEIKPEQLRWFAAVDEVKPVKNKTHLLITASGGCVCLIRIADQKIVFCGYAGGNTHSAEILPDGNIVSASSTGGYLRLFRLRYDSPDEAVQFSCQDYFAENAQGVVWDKKRNCLWSSGQQGICRWHYRQGSDPGGSVLEVDCCVNTGRDGKAFGGHDLYPVYGADRLYLSGDRLLLFDPESMTYEEACPEITAVKSISR